MTLNSTQFLYKASHVTVLGLSPLETKTLEKNPKHKRWIDNYKNLQLFYSQYNRVPFQKEDYPKGNHLGAWLRNQKNSYRKGKMPLWRFHLLSEFNIDWEKKRDSWDEHFAKAKAIQEKKGAPISRYGVCEEERFSKLWLYEQEKSIRKGILTKARIKKLENAGLLIDRNEYRWNSFFTKLSNFVEDYGRVPSAFSSNKNEKSLGKMRLYYLSKMKNGLLSKKQTQELEKLGTDTIHETLWKNNFSKVKPLFQNCLENKCILGENGLHSTLGDPLYNWWKTQRLKYSQGKLNEWQSSIFRKYKMNLTISELANSLSK